MNKDKLDELKEMAKQKSICPYFYELIEKLVIEYERLTERASDEK